MISFHWLTINFFLRAYKLRIIHIQPCDYAKTHCKLPMNYYKILFVLNEIQVIFLFFNFFLQIQAMAAIIWHSCLSWIISDVYLFVSPNLIVHYSFWPNIFVIILKGFLQLPEHCCSPVHCNRAKQEKVQKKNIQIYLWAAHKHYK